MAYKWARNGALPTLPWHQVPLTAAGTMTTQAACGAMAKTNRVGRRMWYEIQPSVDYIEGQRRCRKCEDHCVVCGSPDVRTFEPSMCGRCYLGDS